MIERRRLRAGVEVEVWKEGVIWWLRVGGVVTKVYDLAVDLITEPIPEEEATGEVERAAAHIRGQMDAAKSGLRDIDEAYRLGGVPYLVQALRVRAMEAEQRDKDKDRAMADLLARVEALEEEVRDLNRGLGAKRDHGHKTFVWIDEVEDELRRREDRHQVLVDRVVALEPPRRATPAPAAADGPSAEEVVAIIEKTGSREARWAIVDRWGLDTLKAEAVRLIRAGAGGQVMNPIIFQHSDREAVVSGQGCTWRISIQDNGWFRKPTLLFAAFREGR